MKNKLIKPLATIAFIVIACFMLSRILLRSESVADYALKHPEEQVTVEVEPIPSPTPNITEAVKIESTEEITPTPEPVDEIENIEAFYYEEIPEDIRAKMVGKSYADNIDENLVNFDMLRYVVIKYNDFDGNVQIGEIVCNEAIAQDLVEIFEELYEANYQIESVKLIDEFDADDDTSMEANNTSCFCYRVVDRTTKLSLHAYGRAIDLNPLYNPYVQFRDGEEYVCPSMSVEYADRNSDFPYKIDENDLAYKLFKEHGFAWGGAWNSCKDYQHFEKREK